MINEKEVCKWIEKKNNIKLYPSQERFISSLISGCDINCPRGFGRTSLVKWYSEYLNEVYSKKPFDYNSECYITLKEFIDDSPEHVNIEANINHVLKYLSKEKFEKDFVANYDDYKTNMQLYTFHINDKLFEISQNTEIKVIFKYDTDAYWEYRGEVKGNLFDICYSKSKLDKVMLKINNKHFCCFVEDIENIIIVNDKTC